MAGKTFENPLLSHARMRGLYRGLVEARALKLVPRESEACFVAACIDLQDGDFAFSTVGPNAPDYLRQLGARKGSGAQKSAGLRQVTQSEATPFAGTGPEAVLVASGAAQALKGVAGGGVAVVLIGAKKSTQAEWVRTLSVTNAANLPLVTLVLPTAGETDWTLAGKRAGMPVIPVDAVDAVALYRVVQESIVRARADQRGAILECMAGTEDPIRIMGVQLVAKRIANQRWLEAVETRFTALLAGLR